MINYESLAQKYDTPLYIYDGAEIKKNYEKFVNAFSVKNLKVHYACKALTNISILKLMKSLGAGIDCVSLNEVRLAIEAGFNAQEIIYTPNNVSEQEYDDAIALGVHVNVDNIHMLEYIGHKYPDYPLCIRFNPHIMAGGNAKISVGHIDSKFGISIHQFPLVKRLIKSLNLNIEGIHIHTGSEIADVEIYMRGAELVLGIAEQIPSIEYIDFGSGFKVAYKEGDYVTDIEKLGKVFSDRFNEYCNLVGKDITLRFEPGKYLVSNAGSFLCQVNVIKQTTACTFLGLNSGFNHLVRPMFYDAYHEVVNVSNPGGNQKLYNIVGYICETDTFAHDRILPEVRTHDLLVFRNAGAYCFTMASNYNLRERPAEVLIWEGKDYLIGKRETYEDLVSAYVDPQIEFDSEAVVITE